MLNFLVSLFHIHDWNTWVISNGETRTGIVHFLPDDPAEYEVKKVNLQYRTCKKCGYFQVDRKFK